MIASAARYVPALPVSRSISGSTCTPPASGRLAALMRTRRPLRPAGCCLCDDAREVLERVRPSRPFELDERDIEADDALHAAYLERIPVVTIDGEEAFELFVDETRAHAPTQAHRR